ncbi:hypothetical protein B9Z55_026291 [Caenorhabditis nigoni]|uniref:Uncharacterized protein n=2 Tax=Caenorhabditis nigoni TaxID=1611254 RepID=A0A2G5T2Z4_9PELO|nr:hypothetical protein B9Z55_026291 [Caenorhabditis nigoni]
MFQLIAALHYWKARKRSGKFQNCWEILQLGSMDTIIRKSRPLRQCLGFSFSVGQVASTLRDVFGCRQVFLAEPVIDAAGILLSIPEPNIYKLYLTCGRIAGAGFERRHNTLSLNWLERYTARKHKNVVNHNGSIENIIKAVATDFEDLNPPISSRTGTMNLEEAADDFKNLRGNLKEGTPQQFISELER